MERFGAQTHANAPFHPTILSPRKLCVHVAIGFSLHFNPWEILSCALAGSGQKITKFPTCSEKFSTFNECLFSHLKLPPPHVDPSSHQRQCVWREAFSKCDWGWKKSREPFPKKPPDHLEMFQDGLDTVFLLLHRTLFSFQKRNDNPLLNLKRHFEYISLRRDMGKEIKCEKAF